MFCSVCGAQAQETDRFCPKCGRAMTAASPAAYAAQPGSGGAPFRPIHYGGFWIRFVASFIDGLILSVPISCLVLILIAIVGGATAAHFHEVFSGDPDQFLSRFWAFIPAFIGFFFFMLLASIAIQWLYYAMLESSTRQATIGKMILHLKVTDMNGNRLSFAHASGRFFGKVLNHFIPLAIGFIIAGFTDKKQALHDFIAGTVVVYHD
jgi:uncharacterized RDD family membrane protein YckC